MTTSNNRPRMSWIVLLLPLLAGSSARGQEGIFSFAATQPSTGVLYIKGQYSILEYGSDPDQGQENIKESSYTTLLAYGFNQNLSLVFHFDDVSREFHTGGTPSTVSGQDDLMLMLKVRLNQNDSGPVDTKRSSLMAGMQVDGGDSDFPQGSYPMIGYVETDVENRIGWNWHAMYSFRDGTGQEADDELGYGGAFLYRIAPERYSSSTRGSWYGVLELHGAYWMSGDHEILLGSGLMYEGLDAAFEVGMELPVYQDLDVQQDLDLRLTAGWRLLF